MAAGEWTVETKLVPMTSVTYQELLHLPQVVAHITDLANRTKDLTEHPDEFAVVVQNDPGRRRSRALVHPAGTEGIKRELAESVLVKAIASMAGQ